MLTGAGALRRLVLELHVRGIRPVPELLARDRVGQIEFEDYSHFALASRFAAAAQGLPFATVRSLLGSDLLGSDDGAQRIRHREFESPFGGERVVLLPPVSPDVVVIHWHRGDRHGNVQIWGATSVIEEQARAGATVVATVEQLVESRIRATPRAGPWYPGCS
jgi:glutaconate CoA-transferase subunit A